MTKLRIKGLTLAAFIATTGCSRISAQSMRPFGSGDHAGCIACHTEAEGGDFVLTSNANY